MMGAGLALWLSGEARAEWPDHYLSRLQAYAMLQSLNAELLSNRSATAVLEGWCRRHQLGPADATIVAVRDRNATAEASAEQLARLRVAANSELRYRRVELRCGERVLSRAENWYVPARLTPEMNRLLDETDTPFGRVVAPLQPFRQSISAQLLWSPLGPDGSCPTTPAAGAALDIPAELLQHRALLYANDLQPIAEVSEVYQRSVLDAGYRACASCAEPATTD